MVPLPHPCYFLALLLLHVPLRHCWGMQPRLPCPGHSMRDRLDPQVIHREHPHHNPGPRLDPALRVLAWGVVGDGHRGAHSEGHRHPHIPGWARPARFRGHGFLRAGSSCAPCPGQDSGDSDADCPSPSRVNPAPDLWGSGSTLLMPSALLVLGDPRMRGDLPGPHMAGDLCIRP